MPTHPTFPARLGNTRPPMTMSARRMKTFLHFARLLPLGFAAALSTSAQGTFSFTNNNQARTVPVTGCDGKPLSGDGYRVEVLVKHPGNSTFVGGLEHIGRDSKWSPLEPVPLFTGKAAGIFHGGTVRVPFIPPGQDALLRIRVWQVSSGADFTSAKIRGETETTVKLGGVGNPPSLPTRLTELKGPVVCAAK